MLTADGESWRLGEEETARRLGEGERGRGRVKIRSHRDLEVYRLAFELAVKIFEVSKLFPVEEKYSLTDQMRRSSCSVCADIGEVFRKRKYEKSFIAKLNDAEGEDTETQVWIEFAQASGYMS